MPTRVLLSEGLDQVQLLPPHPETVSTVFCSDGESECPEETTCCENSDGSWGCCPIPEQPPGTEPMMAKVAAFTSPPTTTTPMATAQRPAYTSREEGTSEQEAVCCFDGEHCCPTNYKCDESRRTCYKGEVAIPWYTKVPAVEGGSVDLDSVPCDRENRCPVHFTCCQLSSGQWGCCPLYEAVCCPDQEHCCPWGYSCNVHTASCWRVSMVQLHTIPYTRVVLAKPRLEPSQDQVVHCQGVSFCTEGETCCWLSSNAWACCPTSNAVCCGDMTHCCPAGHTCGDGGTCTQDVSLQWNNWHMFFARRGQRAHTP
ncbi:unnamed protein product [Merluccius merluccius]